MKKIYSVLFVLCTALFAVSCSNDFDEAREVGYLKLDFTTLVSTNTRAVQSVPNNYAPKMLHVTLEGENTKLESDYDHTTGEFKSDALKGKILLPVGTYTITAHSANWDGSDSGFDAPYYYGETTVVVEKNVLKTATVKCTQDNVKVTVNWDSSFETYFKSAKAEVTSGIPDVTPRAFTMKETTKSAYFPVSDLTVNLSVVNKNDVTLTDSKVIEDLHPRDHLLINYKIAKEGQGSITVTIDDTRHQYTYDIEVPLVDIALEVNEVTETQADFISGNYAKLSGSAKGKGLEQEKLSLEYKKSGDEAWTKVNATDLQINTLTEDNATVEYTLAGISAATPYMYRIGYENNGEMSYSNSRSFMIKGEELYNGGFEIWCEETRAEGGKSLFPDEPGKVYWSTSNPGATGMGQGNLTTPEETYVHGGARAAKLSSALKLGILAAASIYTGEFGGLKGMQGAKLNWGVPFTSRPKSLRGYMRYEPAQVTTNKKVSGAPAKGDNDHCQIYCALLTEQLHVDNTKIEETFPNWETDERVIAYGELTVKEKQDGWVEFEIPLDYHNTETMPSYLHVLASSSKYGDYFHGGASTLYLDDFELVY